jgi:hypothetical protein
VFNPRDRVVVDHAQKLLGDIQPAAPTAFEDRPNLLIGEPDVGAVAAAVVNVVDHVRRLVAGRNVNEQAAPARPVGVENLDAAHHQRWADLVARNLTHAISELGQFDPAHLASPAVVILHSDNQQATVDSKGRQVLGQLGIVRAFASRKLPFEIHPVGFVEQPAGGGLDDVGPPGGRPPALFRPQVCARRCCSVTAPVSLDPSQ